MTPARTPAPPAPPEHGRRAIFVEPWWLDAAAPGAWDATVVERDGRVHGWLPYASLRRDRLSWCGIPPLTRLLFPIVNVAAGKSETLGRRRFHVESALVAQLPPASAYEFILPPDGGNAVAWQALGFDARVQHTFIVDPATSDAALWQQISRKTRNLVRRAEDGLQVRPLTTDEFVGQYRRNLGSVIEGDHAVRVHRLATAAEAHGQGRAVGAVDKAGVIHAAVLFLWDQHDYYYFLSTRDAEVAELGAVDLLVWRGILDAMARRLRFDFDGVSSRSRWHFLQSFGGRLASRIVLTRRTVTGEARLLLRRLRHRLVVGKNVERFP